MKARRVTTWIVCVLAVVGGVEVRGEAAAATKPAKLWVEDLPAFVNANPSERWVVGRSTGPCLSEQEAADEAHRDAVTQLVARLRSGGRLRRGVDEAWLAQRLTREMAMGEMVADRLVSRNRRPYGELWSEAILVKASDRRLAGIGREMESRQRRRDEVVAGAIGAGAVASAGIVLAYLFLNWVTRGYFRGRLRLGAGAAFGLGVLVLVWFVRISG
jgi:hypothetical protein